MKTNFKGLVAAIIAYPIIFALLGFCLVMLGVIAALVISFLTMLSPVLIVALAIAIVVTLFGLIQFIVSIIRNK